MSKKYEVEDEESELELENVKRELRTLLFVHCCLVFLFLSTTFDSMYIFSYSIPCSMLIPLCTSTSTPLHVVHMRRL